jgi:hypothetical protein
MLYSGQSLSVFKNDLFSIFKAQITGNITLRQEKHYKHMINEDMGN